MIKSNVLQRFIKDTRGANMVEYIILVGVVALISIIAFKTFGGKVQDKIKEQGATVGTINAGPGSLSSRRLTRRGLDRGGACPGRQGEGLQSGVTGLPG
jgi:pilus assembly protein Flp/PilA